MHSYHSASSTPKTPEEQVQWQSLEVDELLRITDSYMQYPSAELAATIVAKARPFLKYIGKEDLFDGITTQAT
jgi:hypothetical protein